MMWVPSTRLRVALSHSASTSTPLVGSASIAFSSAGLFLMSFARGLLAEDFGAFSPSRRFA
jgi:hypothetical protein